MIAVVEKSPATGKVTVNTVLVPAEALNETVDKLLPVISISPDPWPSVVLAVREVTCVAPVVICVQPI